MTCEEIIGNYISQLKGEFACIPTLDNRIRLITPYLYPDHDRIELFIRPTGDDVVVSDLGETLRYLDTAGMEIIGYPKRQFKANRITEGLGVQMERGTILKRGKVSAIGELVFDVVTACKAVSDLVYSGKAYEPAVFDEEVKDFLASENINAEMRVPIVGQSTSDYKVDLRVYVDQTESLIATISPKSPAGATSRVDHVIRMWGDVNDSREKYTLYNDEVTIVRPEDVYLLEHANSFVHRWTARELFVAALKKEERVH
jgi:hypothetical protein